MSEFGEFARARWPWTGSGHGPLPVLLVMLTMVTGLVDSVSYVALGHVFVANMTGNVVFLGFAIAGAPGLSVGAALVAAAAFLVGATAGGRIGAALTAHRGRMLRAGSGTSCALVALAAVVALVADEPVSPGARYALIVILALAMGVQNAIARRLAVPDLTTTVLTLTLTGIAADSKLAGGPGGHPARRLISVAAMLLGALAGALLVINVDLALPLGIAAALLGIVAAAAHRYSRGDPEWAR
jgi:uncharacterized membrane protein YoaK (UPF0700 family)